LKLDLPVTVRILPSMDPAPSPNNPVRSIADAAHLFFGRRSIRVFKPGPLDPAALTPLLEAAMAAPSAVAKDPWRFVVIRKPETLEKLAAVLSNGEMVLQAGTVIAVCGDLDAAHDRQLSYLLQDCAAAIENLLLCAHLSGLGACWLGVHPREKRIETLRGALGLPDTVIPVACIAIGYPGETKEPRTRYDAGHVSWERWGGEKT
jgi:nitroreductase